MIRDYSHLLEPTNIPSCPICQKVLQQGDAGSQIILHGCYALVHEDCIDTVCSNVSDNSELLELRFIQIINAACGYKYFHLSYPESLHTSDDYHEKINIKSGYINNIFKQHKLNNQLLTAFGPLSFYELPNFGVEDDHRPYIIATEIKGHVLSMIVHKFDGRWIENWELYRIINEVAGFNFLDNQSEDEAKIDMLKYFEENTQLEYGTLKDLKERYQLMKTVYKKSGTLMLFKTNDAFILASEMTVHLVEYQRIVYATVDELVVLSLFEEVF